MLTHTRTCFSTARFVAPRPHLRPNSAPAHVRVRPARSLVHTHATMKFWDFSLAYNPGKARLVLNEKGLPFETQYVNLLNGDSLKPDFLRLNPAGTLPVLEDEGKTIKESKEIVEYVDAKGGQTIGGSEVDRQLVSEWVNKIDAWDGNLFVAGALKGAPQKIMGSIGDFRLKYAEARLKENPDLADVYEAKIKVLKATAAKGQDADAIRQNKEQLVAILDDAEAQLGKSAFLAGPAYSIADVMLTAVLNRITSIGGPAGEAKYITPRAKVTEYFNTVKARPSYAKTYSNSPAPVLGALAKATLSRVTGWY